MTTERDSLADHKNAQQAILAVQKSGVKLVKDATNPHFKNTYITLGKLLEVVLPILHENDLLLWQVPSNIDGNPSLLTVFEHVPSGAQAKGEMPLILDKNNSQGHGSAITYARRYALMTMLGFVADEDDDGEAASKPTKREVVRQTIPDSLQPDNTTPRF